MVVWAARGAAQADLGRLRPALARRLVGLPGVRRPDRARRRATGAAPAATCADRRPSGAWTATPWSTPDGERHPVTLQLPGRVNRANAATALAVAAQFGVRPADAVPRLAQVASVAGRYATVERDGRTIRLLLAKNPAGWLEAFDMAEPCPTLLSINARDPDGLDTSWLYDVDFSPLAGPPRPDHRRPGDGPRRPAGGQRGAVRARARRSAGARRRAARAGSR